MYLTYYAMTCILASSARQSIHYAIEVLLPPLRIPETPNKRFDHQFRGLGIDIAVLVISPRPLRYTDSFPYGCFFVFVAVQVAPLTFTAPASVWSEVLTEMCVALSTCNFLSTDVAHSITTVAYELVAAA